MKLTHKKYIISVGGRVPDFNFMYTTKNKAEEALHKIRADASKEYNELLESDQTDPHTLSDLTWTRYRKALLDAASVHEIYITYEIKD